MAELAPSEASKAGIAVVAISWPTSEHREANPMPRMLRLSHWDFDGLSLFVGGSHKRRLLVVLRREIL
jgi:hypothetical protein